MSIPCKSDTTKEFTFSPEHPGLIGIKPVGERATAWMNERIIQKAINEASQKVNFWNEVLERLREVEDNGR